MNSDMEQNSEPVAVILNATLEKAASKDDYFQEACIESDAQLIVIRQKQAAAYYRDYGGNI